MGVPWMPIKELAYPSANLWEMYAVGYKKNCSTKLRIPCFDRNIPCVVHFLQVPSSKFLDCFYHEIEESKVHLIWKNYCVDRCVIIQPG